MLGRREFLAGAAGAWFAGALPTFAAEDGDWGSAFRKLGFDPSGEDCATFVVIGDPHVPWADKVGGKTIGDESRHIVGRMAEWNAMKPRPKAVLSMGDQISTVTTCMGDRRSELNPKCRAQAEADLRLFRSYFDKPGRRFTPSPPAT